MTNFERNIILQQIDKLGNIYKIFPYTKVNNVSDEQGTKLSTLLNDKVSKEQGKGLSTNDFTDEEKQKLADLENIVVDGALDKNSQNPVENKVITYEIDKINDEIGNIGEILDLINGEVIN